jgi:hypothetical protein
MSDIVVSPEEGEKEKEYELQKKITKENYVKAENILRGYFKSLYENAGMEWTRKDDKEIKFVIDAIKNMAFLHVGEFLLEKTKREEKIKDNPFSD